MTITVCLNNRHKSDRCGNIIFNIRNIIPYSTKIYLGINSVIFIHRDNFLS